MDKPTIGPIAAPLAQRLGPGADAKQVAQAVAAVWQEIDQALSPIIGAGGVLALFQRSVHLAAVQHPWLQLGLGTPRQAGFDTGALAALLARQDAAQALACGTLLCHSLHGLLTSLIGASLTGRLLLPVWGPPPSSASAQDMPP
jgi:stage V sporulation protein SpoVS